MAGWESHLLWTPSHSFDLHQTTNREELSDLKMLDHKSETHSVTKKSSQGWEEAFREGFEAFQLFPKV